jgi:cytochrome c oxidase subunit 1
MYPEFWGKVAAITVFLGFNLTFFPQFILGRLGMPRRYHAYPAEFQILNEASTLGASILAVGYALPLVYLLASLWTGRRAPDNPWGATGLEWQTSSPPPKHNFDRIPVVTTGPYEYSSERAEQAAETPDENAVSGRPVKGAAGPVREGNRDGD